MFLFVQKHRFLISAILGLIALTFVGFGIGSYQWSNQNDDYLVKVGHLVVTVDDFKKATERLASSGKIEITPVVKQQILDELISHNLLAIEAENQAITLSDKQVARIILLIPQLQEGGKFSELRYRYLLESRHETAKEFEQAVRKQFMIQAQLMPFLSGQITSHQQIDRLISLFSQDRVVRFTKIEPKNFVSQAKVNSADIKKYYQKHINFFKLPEAVKIDFLIIPAQATSFNATPKALKAYYDTHRALYEKRKIAHILIQTPANSTVLQKTKARQQAEALLKKLRANPSIFGKLAKENSQDPTSAEQGGNIGEITRGMTVKPFEDIAFKLKAGEISSIVTTQYGYHIIRADKISTENFESVKSLIVAQLQDTEAKKAFKKDSRLLSQMVYNHKTLKQIAQTLKRSVQKTDWITRDSIDNHLLGHPQVLAQAFNVELYKNKVLGSPIRLNDGGLLVLQVKERREAQQQTFKEVESQILQILINQQSVQLAYHKGQLTLKALQQDRPVSILWDKPLSVSLSAPNDSLSPEDVRRIFATPLTNKLPTYNGFRASDGTYWLFKIESTQHKSAILTQAEKEQLKIQLEESHSYGQIAAYINKLRSVTSILYNTSVSR